MHHWCFSIANSLTATPSRENTPGGGILQVPELVLGHGLGKIWLRLLRGWGSVLGNNWVSQGPTPFCIFLFERFGEVLTGRVY